MENVTHDIIGWWIADLNYHKCVEVKENTHFSGTYKNWEIPHKNKLSEDCYEMCYQGNYVKVYRHLDAAKSALIHRINCDGGKHRNEFIENVKRYGDSKYNEIYDRDRAEKHKKWENSVRFHAYLIAEADGFCKSPEEYWSRGMDKEREESQKKYEEEFMKQLTAFSYPSPWSRMGFSGGCPTCGTTKRFRRGLNG
jgi:hypothetical protein